MQTFMPYPDFAASAQVLDRQRLGKQRIEAKQIARVLLGESDGWCNHPAVQMWRGHLTMLCMYGYCICAEWRRRGYRDAQLPWFDEQLMKASTSWSPIAIPSWIGREDFHASHRAALLAKDSAWYGRFGWSERPRIAYVWPA